MGLMQRKMGLMQREMGIMQHEVGLMQQKMGLMQQECVSWNVQEVFLMQREMGLMQQEISGSLTVQYILIFTTLNNHWHPFSIECELKFINFKEFKYRFINVLYKYFSILFT